MKVSVVRADYGKYTEVFLNNGYVAIGWFDDPLNDFSDKNEIIKKYDEIFSTDIKMRKSQNVGQIYRFLNELKIDNFVITPYNDQRLIVGRIISEPYFEKDESTPYYYRIKVKWFDKEINRTNFSIPLQNTLRSSLTVYNVYQVDEVLSAIGVDVPQKFIDAKKKPVKHIDLIEIIREKLLLLDATEFELLVSYVLRSLGFEAKQEIGGVGDGGVDFEGELNVMGVASINLQVQVKRYMDNRIGERDIRNFRGALKNGFQGCFITLSDFNKKAIVSASDPEKTLVKLINGKLFVELFIEHYDDIIKSIHDDENDEFAEKLKFKRMLIPI